MEFQEILEAITQILIIPLLPLIFLLARAWIQSQIEYINDKNEREYLNYHINAIESLILDVVTSIEQIYVKGLKEEGAFTRERQLEMLNLAKETILCQLTQASREVLEKTYADYLAWIESKIEENVYWLPRTDDCTEEEDNIEEGS